MPLKYNNNEAEILLNINPFTSSAMALGCSMRWS